MLSESMKIWNYHNFDEVDEEKVDQTGMGALHKIVGVAVGLLVAALLMPVALNSIANATLTNVDAAVITIFQVLLPVLAVIAIAIYFLKGD